MLALVCLIPMVVFSDSPVSKWSFFSALKNTSADLTRSIYLLLRIQAFSPLLFTNWRKQVRPHLFKVCINVIMYICLMYVRPFIVVPCHGDRFAEVVGMWDSGGGSNLESRQWISELAILNYFISILVPSFEFGTDEIDNSSEDDVFPIFEIISMSLLLYGIFLDNLLCIWLKL